MEYNSEAGYRIALEIARNHYENFPVVSFLIKKELQRHIAIIYYFARTADDIADEGNLDDKARLCKLDEFENSIKEISRGIIKNDIDAALSETFTKQNLSPEYLINLIAAFKQDTIKKRYKTFDDILGYCRLSANPVGRMLLSLYGYDDEKLFLLSDKICSALQITNFLQDIFIDYKKDRIYLAEEDLKDFSVSKKWFEKEENNHNFHLLIKKYINILRIMFNEGEELVKHLKGLFKYEILWTINGGREILNRLENDYTKRPKLSKLDFLKLLIKSVV